MAKKNDKKKEERCCYLCGEVIADEKFEEIKTKRGTKLIIHTRCIPRGRNYVMGSSDR